MLGRLQRAHALELSRQRKKQAAADERAIKLLRKQLEEMIRLKRLTADYQMVR